ncbi:MAG: ATP-binding protein [Clostridia bacterium]|nr:ATP-binding protein [Clostridia bacterium]MBP3707154.1 ATP-binding protein [Clostridia bacterium]
MKFISKEKWKELLEENLKKVHEGVFSDCQQGLNKGIKFEILVEYLLEQMFLGDGIVFTGTKTSHDGNKDFWAIDETNEVWWAECKNYSKNISLLTLAPTLILAEINNAQHLLFFSYSKLNTNLKRRIGQYAYEHSKEVYLYDDEVLEALLFYYDQNRLKKLLKIPSEEELCFDTEIEHIFWNEINAKAVDYKYFNGDYEIDNLHVGEVYDLNTVLINRNIHNSYQVCISVIEHPDNYYFDFLSDDSEIKSAHHEKTLEVKPNQILLVKTIVKIVKFKEKLQLPQLTIKVKRSDTVIKESDSVVTSYCCLSTKKDVLIGKDYENLLGKFKQLCLNKNQVSGLLVYGSSGTGKSRILEECVTILLKSNYRILKFAGFGSDSSWKNVVREIAFSLFEISEELENDIGYDVSEIINPKIKEPLKEKIIEFISILKNNSSIQVNIEEYYQIIYEKLSKGKYAIIIDNLQSYNTEIIPFIIKMIHFFGSKQNPSSLVLVFAINTSLIFDKKYFDFISEFENVNGDNINTHLICQQIRGFADEKSAIVYLKTLLCLDDYPLNLSALRKILEKTSLKPKYIEQVANYLLQIGCVTIDNRQGLIQEQNRLESELRKIPLSYETLFQKTYNMILAQNFEKRQNYKNIVSILYLFSELDERLIEVLNLDKETAMILEKHDIIRNIERGGNICYIFEHDLVEMCLSKEIYTDLLEYAFNYIGRFSNLYNGILKDKRAQYTLCQLYNKEVSLQQLIEISNHIEYFNIPNKFIYKFFEYIIHNFILYKDELDMDLFITNTLHCCKFVRDHISEIQAELLFEQIFPHIFDTLLDTSAIMKAHFSFVIHYCENKNRLHKAEKSINIYSNYLEKLNYLENKFPDLHNKFFYARAYINNRIFVCGKIEGHINRYFEELKLSIRISKKNKYYDILFENYFDAANLYFQGKGDKEKGLRLLEKGFQSFNFMPIDIKEKFIVNYYAKKIVYYLLKGDLEQVETSLQNAFDNIRENQKVNYHIFFKGRYMKYKIIKLLLEKRFDVVLDKAFEDYGELLQIINNTEDFEWYFLQAKYAYYLNNENIFKQMFIKCYNYIEKNMYIGAESREVYMIKDLSVMWRNLVCSKEEMDFLNYRTETLKTVNYILTLPEENFKIYNLSYQSSAPIVDIERRDGYFT